MLGAEMSVAQRDLNGIVAHQFLDGAYPPIHRDRCAQVSRSPSISHIHGLVNLLVAVIDEIEWVFQLSRQL
jgi:hypothetical protein